MRDFFRETGDIITKKLGNQATEEQIKAFLHYTEVKYKAEDKLLPIRNHRKDYEEYSFAVLRKASFFRPFFAHKMEKFTEDYRVYKYQQQIKINMAKILETSVIPEITKFTKQKKIGYHGLEHTEMVALRALDVALSMGRYKTNELMPVILAAAIHDCARTDDEYNEYHGPNAAKMPEVQNFLDNPEFSLTPQQKKSVLQAAVYHTIAMPNDNKDYDYIQKSLFDADRIRLSWEKSYAPQYLFTRKGHELANMNPYRVMDYLGSWDMLMKRGDTGTVYGTLSSKYAIRYNRKVGHNRVAFLDIRERGANERQNTR